MEDRRHKDYTHFFCICCGEPTTSIGYGPDEVTDKEYTLESAMYRKSVVDTISAGYGSTHDGDVYYISVCDDCADKALKDGRLAYKDNHMDIQPDKELLDEWDNGYKKRMRNFNIKDLLD